MRICITGTPGTGKTTLAKGLESLLKYEYFDVMDFIKKNRLYEKFDKKTQALIIDTDKLVPELIKEVKKKKNLIIDSHLSHYLPKELIDLVVVTKCELKELKKRLEKRKYSKEKVRENLDSEIFGICLMEAKEHGHEVFVVYTAEGLPDDAKQKLLEKIDKLA